MKHLLNNLSEEEKDSIRGQHTGGMVIKNKKFIELTESKLGHVKPYLTEQASIESQNPPSKAPQPSILAEPPSKAPQKQQPSNQKLPNCKKGDTGTLDTMTEDVMSTAPTPSKSYYVLKNQQGVVFCVIK